MILTKIETDVARRAIFAGAAVAVSGAVAYQGFATTRYVLVALVAIAFCIAELTPLTLPRGGEIALSGGVATVAIAMLHPAAAAGVLIIGICAAGAIRDEPPRPVELATDVARRLVALVFAYWILSAGRVIDELIFEVPSSSGLAVLIAGCVYMLVDVFGFALLDSLGRSRRVFRSTASLLSLVGGIYLSQVFVGAAATIVYSSLQAAGFIILFVLMLLLQSSFALLLRVRAAYSRTLSAVARLSECEAGGSPGHSQRVAEIAAAIARVRHLGGHDVEILSYAALLHNVGEVHGGYCEAGGSTSLSELFDDIPYLTGVGAVVSASLVPYSANPVGDPRAHLLGGVLRVACAYDVSRSGVHAGEAAITGVFPKGDYDPASIKALDVAIDRQEVC